MCAVVHVSHMIHVIHVLHFDGFLVELFYKFAENNNKNRF